MKRWIAKLGLVVILAQTALAWRPAGWVFFDWPWAYEAESNTWHWFSEGDGNIQWVHGFPPADGWESIEASQLAGGWSWYTWPYAFCQSDGAWYYVNEPDIQWVANMTTGTWSLYGRLFGELPW